MLEVQAGDAREGAGSVKKTVDVWITMDKLGCITSPEVFLIELIARMRARESRGDIVVPATLTYEVPAKARRKRSGKVSSHG